VAAAGAVEYNAEEKAHDIADKPESYGRRFELLVESKAR